MSAAPMQPPSEVPPLGQAPWLTAPSTQAVLAALSAAGFEGRIVGGAVRNALLGLDVADIDVATPAAPHDVLKACAKAGLRTVPTGLDHGTVTVIAGHAAIEVTTLRRDVATDGRRAVVAFTDDWSEDARRRDFTMNALYCNAKGLVEDYVGGWPDLVARRVRFIGNADQRIAEDYLRILRFFRFHAAFGEGEPDRAAMAACARGVAGIARLSAERIRAEMVKLLGARGVIAAIRAMEDAGLLPAVLGAAPRPDVLAEVVGAEEMLGLAPDVMLRLSALAIAAPDDIARLASRLRLSNEEQDALLVIDDATVRKLDRINARRARQIVYRQGASASRRLAVALAAVVPERRDEADVLLATSAAWPPPKLPVSGADLLARGLAPGRHIGDLLDDLEAWWVDADFPGEAATCAHLDALIAPGKAG